LFELSGGAIVKQFRTTVLATVFSILLALVLLVPSGGIDTDPPECYSFVGYVVPCGAGFAGVGALIAALLVVGGSVAGRQDRHRG
jgi:hypothetical protein